jgi:hypothetical protein
MAMAMDAVTMCGGARVFERAMPQSIMMFSLISAYPMFSVAGGRKFGE